MCLQTLRGKGFVVVAEMGCFGCGMLPLTFNSSLSLLCMNCNFIVHFIVIEILYKGTKLHLQLGHN